MEQYAAPLLADPAGLAGEFGSWILGRWDEPDAFNERLVEFLRTRG